MKRHMLRMAMAAVAAVTMLVGGASAQVVSALTNTGTLVTFNAASPGTILTANAVTGLTAGDTLAAIDFRPIDQQLIGVGYNSATGTARVYAITSTGVATSINANTLNVGIGLARLVADFNPTANAIRVTTSAAAGNNLRITAAGAGTLATDTDLAPANNGIRSSAYSRNNAGGGTSGATTLYLIDGTNNALDFQGSVDFFTGNGTSPNTGALTSAGTLTGVTGSTVVGFDIYTTPGTAATNPGVGYVATGSNLFAIDLTNGSTSPLGMIGSGLTVTDIAVVAVPEPSSLCLTAAGLLAFGRYVRRRR